MHKNPHQLLSQSDVIYTQHQVDDAITVLASKISQALQDKSPLVLTVMNGGLYFAGQLISQLNFPLELDYIQASRYNADTVGREIAWRTEPTDQVKGRTVLLLDDILDEESIDSNIIAYAAIEEDINDTMIYNNELDYDMDSFERLKIG
jgi:hypoxanthine phosphoribosyltransferase